MDRGCGLTGRADCMPRGWSGIRWGTRCRTGGGRWSIFVVDVDSRWRTSRASPSRRPPQKTARTRRYSTSARKHVSVALCCGHAVADDKHYAVPNWPSAISLPNYRLFDQYNFGRVCLSVCLSDDKFRKPWLRTFIFTHPVYLQGIRVRFVHEGHRVKVKVTGGKQVENPYSRNAKLPSAITPVL